ncbi:hypothetical protein [Massilia sp.]|uniref:hypothetical protein n=1 Tax=Massilia sp. TaxID=1882437 RepID=UPI0028A726B0|nr:hypothetical protein [Massilia sp.]
MKPAYLAIPLVLAVPCAVSYYVGVFSTSFDTNVCYSELLSTLSSQAEQAAASGDRAEIERYAARIKSLPNRGYESDCSEIMAALQASAGNAASTADNGAGAR